MGDKEEIYVTCICGALVNEASMTKHFDKCFKEDFIQHSVTLKINRSLSEHSRKETKEREVCAICIRCGHDIVKGKGTLVTFYPSMENNRINCCRYKDEVQKIEKGINSICKMCKFPSHFHKSEQSENEKEIVNCIDTNQKDAKTSNHKEVSKSGTKWRKKCRVPEVLSCLDSIYEQEESDVNGVEHEHSVVHDELATESPCKQCHVALLPNYSKEKDLSPCQQTYSLLVQILDRSPSSNSQSTQTDLPDRGDVGIQVKISGVYPEEVEQLLGSGKSQYSVPGFDAAAEAAFRSHLQSLIPCTHCDRTFSPDRIMRHQSCCIERPRTREYMTPVGSTITE